MRLRRVAEYHCCYGWDAGQFRSSVSSRPHFNTPTAAARFVSPCPDLIWYICTFEMKIACLQYAPKVAKVDDNYDYAEAILADASEDSFDLLVLPELAFTGYNFKSAEEISPFLEDFKTGRSCTWAAKAASKYKCTTICGYPEKNTTDSNGYNTAVVVTANGDVVGNYRKHHLYYTDETWAAEGPETFYSENLENLGKTSLGICMDLNPYKFEAPWDAYEFAKHAVSTESGVVVLSMAWNTLTASETFHAQPEEPDMETITYWLTRLMPLIDRRDGKEVIVVFANRTGVEDTVTYVGTSSVFGILDGEIRVYGMLGRGEQKLLVVDTDEPPIAKLRFEKKQKVDDESSKS